MERSGHGDVDHETINRPYKEVIVDGLWSDAFVIIRYEIGT